MKIIPERKAHHRLYHRPGQPVADQQMPASQTLDKDWIDQNLSYLEPRLGKFPLFEPSAAFYADLARLAEKDARVSTAAAPLRQLFSHAGLPELLVHFEDHIPNAGEFRFSLHPKDPDFIVPVCIRIADKYRQISDPQRRGMAIGTILAHEIAHYSMLDKKIRRETTDNERLTDLGLIVLGFGKLWFNGRNLVVEDRSEQLGYLKPLDMTYAFMEYAVRNRIPEDRLMAGLTPDALQLFSFWLGRVTGEVRACREQEARDNARERVQELAVQQAALEKEVQDASPALKALRMSLGAAAGDQEIFNRTIRFWDIPSEDHRTMAAFVNARASGAMETELLALAYLLDKLGREVHDLGTGLRQPSAINCDPAIFRRTLGLSRQALAALSGRMAALQQQVKSVDAVHRRCFAQVGSLQQEVQEVRDILSFSRRDCNEVSTLHAFLAANPACWPGYFSNLQLQERVAPLIRPGAVVSPAAADEKLKEAGRIASLSRQEYAGYLDNAPPLREIRQHLLSERDSAARSRQDIAVVLSLQEQVPEGYLEGARDLERRLQELIISAKGLGADIQGLKPRQDRIYAGHDRLSITAADEEEFAALTRAILSSSPEAEFSAVNRRLSGLSAALLRDMERVKDRKEAGSILPLEAHTRAFDELRHNAGMLSGRVFRWRQVQQAYLDLLDARERRSAGNLLRNAGDRLRAAVSKKKR